MNLLAPVAVLVALTAPSLNGAEPVPPRPVFTVQDPRIDESSSLVDLGPRKAGLMITANDSGDTGIVYVLDGSGRTVGTTRFGASVDAESMAPAGGGEVWVGDTGDNTQTRPDIVVHRVPVGRGDRTVRVPAYRLSYPDGPHDAETLLREPRTGRLYVVTKSLLGGVVYAAPPRLDPDRVNRLRRVGEVPIFATDGAFFQDGRHVIIRGYASADVYAFPAFRLVGSIRLPEQPQGESLSVGPGDRVRIGSEGERQPVLQIRLPEALSAMVAPPARLASSPARADDTGRRSGETGAVDSGTGEEKTVFWSVFGAIVLGLGGLAAVARARRRSRLPED